jgi:hypothetical protein
MSERVATLLEHRYHAIMRAYPVDFRAERGDEIVATLVAAAGERQRWPSVRESLALVVHGLRCRSGGNTRRRATQTWAVGLQLAALMLLAYLAADWIARGLTQFGDVASGPLPVRLELPAFAAGLAAAAAMLLVAKGWLLGGIATTAAGFAAAELAVGHPRFAQGPALDVTITEEWWGWFIVSALLVACLFLTRRTRARSRPVAWPVAILVFAVIPLSGLEHELYWTAILACLAWAVIDARIGIAACGVVLAWAAEEAATAADVAASGRFAANLDYAWWAITFATVALALLAVTAIGARRQARL